MGGAGDRRGGAVDGLGVDRREGAVDEMGGAGDGREWARVSKTGTLYARNRVSAESLAAAVMPC